MPTSDLDCWNWHIASITLEIAKPNWLIIVMVCQADTVFIPDIKKMKQCSLDLTYFVCKLMQQHSVTVGRAVECKPTRSCQIVQGCRREPTGNCAQWTGLNSSSGCSYKLLPLPTWIMWYLISIPPLLRIRVCFCVCVCACACIKNT